MPAAALRLAALSALSLWTWPSSAQHAVYRFATRLSNFESLESYLRWERVERGDVYLATKFFTGCSIGKFGGQIHRDGTQLVILSMWDFDGIAGSAQGASPWCTRFSQGTGPWPHGAGTHCIVPFHFEMGSEYRFEVTKAGNASGALWSLSVSDSGSDPAKLVGSIFVQQEGARRDCSLLEPEAESSQEHYAGGAFYSAAAWRGPFLHGKSRAAPVDVDADCGTDTAGTGGAALTADVSSVVPGGIDGQPTIRFRHGPGVPHGCEQRSLWQHGGRAAPERDAAAEPSAAQFRQGHAGSSTMLWAGGIAALLGASAIAASACFCRGPRSGPPILALSQAMPKEFAIEDNAPAGTKCALLDEGRPSNVGVEEDETGSERSLTVHVLNGKSLP